MKVDSTISGALITAIVVLIAAFIEASVTIKGWREEKRRLREQQLREEQIKYRLKQIEELYGPLWGMVQKNEVIYGVAKKILPNYGDKVRWDMFKKDSDDSNVWNFFFENYLIPNQSKMAELINAKVHLLENGRMPDSFQRFLEHQYVASCLYFLWKEQDKSNLDKVAPNPYPKGFHEDVKKTLDDLWNKYHELVKISHDHDRRFRRRK